MENSNYTALFVQDSRPGPTVSDDTLFSSLSSVDNDAVVVLDFGCIVCFHFPGIKKELVCSLNANILSLIATSSSSLVPCNYNPSN